QRQGRCNRRAVRVGTSCRYVFRQTDGRIIEAPRCPMILAARLFCIFSDNFFASQYNKVLTKLHYYGKIFITISRNISYLGKKQ
ncbi:MAG: hypothetical protein ACI4JZ_02795, partial [Oscillospiraceae bacterium]